MASARILMIEDQVDLAEPLLSGLQEEGYEIALARDGREALVRLKEHWDLIILDLMLPDMSGEAILNLVKQGPYYPLVLVLTARVGMQDKLSLFRQGCDDYLNKPFVFEEISERVKALLRRSQRVVADQASYGDLRLDPVTHELFKQDQSVALTPKEAAMLRILMENHERIIPKLEILVSVWGRTESDTDTGFLDVHLSNLRRKLAQLDCDDWLRTFRGAGVMFAKPGVNPGASAE